MASGLVQQLLSAVTIALLARLLDARELGIAAAANSAMVILTVFTNFGFGQRLVARRIESRRSVSSIFWFAVASGSLVGGIAVVAADALAELVGVPDAGPLIVLLGPAAALQTAGAVPKALLIGQMRFRSVYAIETAWVVVYCVVEIILAAKGFGAKAIPMGLLAGSLVFVLLNVITSRFRPRLALDWAELKEDLGFQGSILANSVMVMVVKNVDYWIVARLLGPAALGQYYIAYVLPNILRQRLTWTSSQVLLPAYARMSMDLPRLRSAYFRSARLHAWIGFPSMAGLAIVAEPLITTCFGEGWEPAVGPMRILALSAMIDFLTAAAPPLFLVVGTPSLNMCSPLVRLGTLVGLLPVVLLSPSLEAVAWVVLASTITGALAAQIVASRLLEAPAITLWRQLLPTSATTMVMVAVTLIVVDLAAASLAAPLTLAAGIAAGAVSYALAQFLPVGTTVRTDGRDVLLTLGLIRTN
jgi:PST family polysaccharide transporter